MSDISELREQLLSNRVAKQTGSNGVEYCFTNGGIDQIISLIIHYTTKQVAATEKAYGGCQNCYGKGYATVNQYASGYATDGDIGGTEGPVRWKLPGIKYCTCDRGKQLKARFAAADTAARLDEFNIAIQMFDIPDLSLSPRNLGIKVREALLAEEKRLAELTAKQSKEG